MKRILIFAFVLGLSLNGYGQEEFKAKFEPIPAKKSKTKAVIPPKEIAPKTNPPAVVKKIDSLEVNTEDLFKDTNLYKKESNSAGVFYRQNQYLGSFKMNSEIATIRYRDAAFVDGDKIKVYWNTNSIAQEVALDDAFKGIKIPLKKGSNRIDIEALNEGFAPPNTAQFEVYDDKGTLITSSQWNVGTGYKASIILVKE